LRFAQFTGDAPTPFALAGVYRAVDQTARKNSLADRPMIRLPRRSACKFVDTILDYNARI
jgi:hypothetical protein